MTHPGRLSCHTPCLPGPGILKKQLQPGWLFPPAMLAWGCRYLAALAGIGPLHSSRAEALPVCFYCVSPRRSFNDRYISIATLCCSCQGCFYCCCYCCVCCSLVCYCLCHFTVVPNNLQIATNLALLDMGQQLCRPLHSTTACPSQRFASRAVMPNVLGTDIVGFMVHRVTAKTTTTPATPCCPLCWLKGRASPSAWPFCMLQWAGGLACQSSLWACPCTS